jgi:multisubunit Na+/H+ antiporter MnhF subunit
LTSIHPDDNLPSVEAERETQQNDIKQKFKGPGGTPGGAGTFIFGLALAIAGGYLIMNQVQVTSGYWLWWGPNTFGLTLIPLVIGLGLLFYDGRSIAGWVLAGGGTVIIFAGILANLQIYFERTTLFNVILMLTLFAAGLGLMARAVKSS